MNYHDRRLLQAQGLASEKLFFNYRHEKIVFIAKTRSPLDITPDPTYLSQLFLELEDVLEFFQTKGEFLCIPIVLSTAVGNIGNNQLDGGSLLSFSGLEPLNRLRNLVLKSAFKETVLYSSLHSQGAYVRKVRVCVARGLY